MECVYRKDDHPRDILLIFLAWAIPSLPLARLEVQLKILDTTYCNDCHGDAAAILGNARTRYFPKRLSIEHGENFHDAIGAVDPSIVTMSRPKANQCCGYSRKIRCHCMKIQKVHPSFVCDFQRMLSPTKAAQNHTNIVLWECRHLPICRDFPNRQGQE
jgi:hypothetical protein